MSDAQNPLLRDQPDPPERGQHLPHVDHPLHRIGLRISAASHDLLESPLDPRLEGLTLNTAYVVSEDPTIIDQLQRAFKALTLRSQRVAHGTEQWALIFIEASILDRLWTHRALQFNDVKNAIHMNTTCSQFLTEKEVNYAYMRCVDELILQGIIVRAQPA